jgi:hypothetical protein
VPAQLDRICRRALERSANSRYPTAAVLRADLMALIASLGVTDAPALLRQRMEEAFFDRIELKREMLRRVRSGETRVGAPPSEPQGLKELMPQTTVERVRRTPSPRRWPYVVAAAGALGLAAAGAVRVALVPEPAPMAAPVAAPVPAAAPAEPPAARVEAPPAPPAVEEPLTVELTPTPTPQPHKPRPAKSHPAPTGAAKTEPAAPPQAPPEKKPADGFTHWE